MFGLKNTKANRLEVRKAYIPNNAIEANYPELDTVVYTYSDSKKFYAMAFVGTAGKPNFHYSFSTEARMTAHVEKFLAGRKQTAEYKAEQKEKNKGTLTGSAATAKVIRERLKKEFPGVKFSVTSDNFSMGNSVRIGWTDGPVPSVVDTITKQYQCGHFDGMDDSYHHSDINPSLGCPGAKYISTSRTQSDERKAEIEAHCMEKYGRIIERYEDYHGLNAWKYENYEPDTWEPQYKAMIDEQDRKRYEAYEAERQEQLAEIQAKRQEVGPDRDIQPLSIETVEDDRRIVSNWPKLNKNDWLIDYTEQLGDKQNYDVSNAKVTEVVILSPVDYDYFTNNLLQDFSWLSGKGGTDSDFQTDKEDFFQMTKEEKEQWREQSYTLAILVKAEGKEPLLVDPQGHTYARYVGFMVVEAPRPSSKVFSLADHKKAKEAKLEAQEQQAAQQNFEHITQMVSLMTTEQLADAIRNIHAKSDFTDEQKLVTIKHFLAILSEKDRPTALKLFKELNLQALAK